MSRIITLDIVQTERINAALVRNDLNEVFFCLWVNIQSKLTSRLQLVSMTIAKWLVNTLLAIEKYILK